MLILQLLSVSHYFLLYIKGYPASQALNTIKENKPEKLWILYFLSIGVLSLLETTALVPVKMILNLISACVWPTIKSLVCLWMYHPTYRGSLFLYGLGKPHLEKYFGLASNAAGKYLAFIGIPVREEKKSE